MTVTEKVRDFAFVSDVKLALIRARLQEQLGGFVASWWRDTTMLKFVDVCEFYTETSLYQEYRIYRNFRCGDEHIVFIGDDSVWLGLFSSLVEGEKIDHPGISQFVLERFCSEFCRLLTDTEVQLEEVTAEGHDDTANRYGSGCVAVELDVDGVPISILLTRGIWKGALAPETNQAVGGISGMIEALSSSTATLSAYFQSESVDCGSLMGLREGDFIPLGQDFTGRVSISCGEMPVVFDGVLGKSGDNRLVKIQK